MPYLKPYSLAWLDFSLQKAKSDMDAGSDPARVLLYLTEDLGRYIDNERSKNKKRNLTEDDRKKRSERMKAMRASGIGGWPKKGSTAPRNAKEGVSDAEG